MKRYPTRQVATTASSRAKRGAVAGNPFVLVLTLLLFGAPIEAEPIVIDFDRAIDDWETLTFPRIENHSEYSVNEKDGRSVLKVCSDRSASGIVYRQSFNVYETPWLEWAWFAGNVIDAGNARERDGDDYPIRLYVMFEYDPSRARLGERLRYNAARLLYGEYPPLASLNYIFNNRPHSERIIPNPFTERAQMFAMESGSDAVGTWRSHRVNMLEDYREAFGEEPPRRAVIAVMGDTDNTGASASAYIDYVRISMD